ncbi:LysR family transcriptional regulator [Pseudohoeflea coraliihabitans]|uniref:LysR family transcriptional regulator n=1 Tax=Pseudohoeflea coraliihabitans TaxID=2860393 RepID=A0ABS6WS42_9HYPH|nr:LysR family transcriptional regulator [Pseudohoeflea sp. DP4N28-3]MBW3098783.1 LysR family transcriptional regulator [Pseudohoeflea sp. DP4N28-3]
MEHLFKNVEWNSVRTLLVVARTSSFRKAAEESGQAINTVRRIITRLEDLLGYKLFYRKAEGVRLTPEGRRVVMAAGDVERSMTDMLKVAQTAQQDANGPVRLAVTEGLGTFWLTPKITDYLDESQWKNRIELQCAMRSVDVMRLEADISIQLVKPHKPDLVTKRLGYLHLVPFASPGYIARYGAPKTLSDLPNHRVVEQETDQLNDYGLDKIFNAELANRMVRLKTNFSSAHYWAVSKGAGIGMMPNYARAIGGDVEYIDFGIHFRTEIWLATHPELLRSARHRQFIDFLTEAFSPAQYPWFGEQLMTPAQIDEEFSREDLRNYFEGFTAA